MARIVLCAVMAVLVCIGGYHLLFNAAIKDVPLESISFSANVYSVEELIENQEWDAIKKTALDSATESSAVYILLL